jgi:hypothetical protein
LKDHSDTTTHLDTESVAIGSRKVSDQNGENNAVKMSGAVSPAARAVTRLMPVTMEGAAADRTTSTTILNLLIIPSLCRIEYLIRIPKIPLMQASRTPDRGNVKVNSN